MVYLDANLVERAKKENINISRLAEEALKQALEIERPRTAQEHSAGQSEPRLPLARVQLRRKMGAWSSPLQHSRHERR